MSVLAPIKKKDNWFVGAQTSFIYIVDDQNSRPRVPRDITGWNVSWLLSLTFSGPAIWSVTAEITTPEEGRVTVVIPGTLTQNMTGDMDYWYTLRRTDAGHEEELSYGTAWLRDVYVNY